MARRWDVGDIVLSDAMPAGMAKTSAKPLQELPDQEAIRDCLYRYCHGAWNGAIVGGVSQHTR
jgi:hypothetical protein